MLNVPEIQILLILAIVLAIATFLARQSLRRNLAVFLIACAAGFFAQLPLGANLNRYTPNIRFYILHVSLAVILTWGVGLVSIFAAHALAARLLKARESLALYLLVGIPILLIVEYIGSNLVRMKLHDYRSYASLMPRFNAMHAPAWLYGYYAAVGIAFYGLLVALRLTAPVPREAVSNPPGQPAAFRTARRPTLTAADS